MQRERKVRGEHVRIIQKRGVSCFLSGILKFFVSIVVTEDRERKYERSNMRTEERAGV